MWTFKAAMQIFKQHILHILHKASYPFCSTPSITTIMELESCQNPAHTQNVFCSRITIHTHTHCGLQISNIIHKLMHFASERNKVCFTHSTNLRKPRTAIDYLFFYALLSRDNDLLSRFLDITKVVFS